MKIQKFAQSVLHWFRRKPILSGVAGIAAIALVATLISASRPHTEAPSYFEIKRGDFLISVVEGGTLEAVNEVVIRNEVEGTSRIIYIVPEGTSVTQGDLLVELDSSSSQDAVNLQQINVEKAQFSLIQSEQQLEIQKSMVDSEVQAATLKVEFAQSDLKKYIEGEAAQANRNCVIEITNVLENLKIGEERLQWSEKLYKQGYETKANLDKDRLAVSQYSLKLEQAQKALWMLETFDQPKKKRELEALLHEARENLERVKLQGDRKMNQYRADVETQKSTLELSRKKLERDLKQLQATKIMAPQDGMAVYASGGNRFSSESMIEEGAVVRNRQELIKLPDVSEMKLQVKIHESHINNIRRGQQAFIVLDSMPDQRFQGVVNKVAPLPDSSSRWGNPNLKVYATEILVTENLPDIKPGVSARAEIVVTNLANALTVPIQAVSTRKGQQVVFLASAPQQPVPVSVGMYNTKYIEITSGLKEGDRVMLSPPFDTDEKDLGGAILADGETVPRADTNKLARSALRAKKRNARALPPSKRGIENPPVPRTLAGTDASALEAASALRAGNGPRVKPADGRPQAGPEGAGRPNREEQLKLLKQFDKNGDGQLDENERAAMRERFASQAPRTNALPGSGVE